jgi:hypothetical protein
LTVEYAGRIRIIRRATEVAFGLHSTSRGLIFAGAITQFCQGVASGGLEQRPQYSGHDDYELSFDFSKLTDADG